MQSIKSAAIRRSLARSVGLSAAIYGYPLVEMLRSCRLQTHKPADLSQASRAPIDTVHLSGHPPLDRGYGHAVDGVLYVTAWIYLAHGPRYLTLPSASCAQARRFQLSFYDFGAERIAEIGSGDEAAAAGKLILVGPHCQVPEGADPRAVLTSTSDLVWLVGHVVVDGSAADVEGRQFDIRLSGAPGSMHFLRPAAVELWKGGMTDAFHDVIERGAAAEEVAPLFFDNLCRALAHVPVRPGDRLLIARFRDTGITAGPSMDWTALDASVRQGLLEGFHDAVECVRKGLEDPRLHAQTASASPGRFGRNFIARSVAAYHRLGAHPVDLVC